LETPQQDAVFGKDEPRDDIGHDIDKPTPIAATPIIATTPKDAIFTACEFPQAIQNDAVRRNALTRRHTWHK
jgi:hypothetical protein